MADDQPGLAGWRRAVVAFRDLAVGPAHTDRHAPHQQGAVLHVRVQDLLQASGPLLARQNRHRAHVCIVAPGPSRPPHPGRGDDSVVGAPDD